MVRSVKQKNSLTSRMDGLEKSIRRMYVAFGLALGIVVICWFVILIALILVTI